MKHFYLTLLALLLFYVPSFAIAPITGDSVLCIGSATVFNDTTSGGKWISSDTLIVKIDTIGNATGISAGTVTITYTVGPTYVTKTINVFPPPAPITGPDTICSGITVTLSDSSNGGTWSSRNTSIANIDTNGRVIGLASGSDTVIYTRGGCTATKVIYVKSLPNAGIILGLNIVCKGIWNPPFTDSIKGGVWGITDTNKAVIDSLGKAYCLLNIGIYGLDTVTYTVKNSCGSAISIFPITVYGGPCWWEVNNVANTTSILEVFPNPNNGTFTVNVLSDKNEHATILISDLLGRQVRKFIINTNNPIEMKSDFPPGLYIMSAFTSEGNYITKLIVE